MRAALLLIFCFFLTMRLSSQDRSAFLEIGGSGGLGSINYERVVLRPMRKPPPDAICGTPDPAPYIFTFRAGLGFSPIDKNNGSVFVFPVMGNIIFGRNEHKLEGGVGLAPSITTRGSWYIKSPLMLGYRFEPSSRNIFFRITYTPIIGWLVDFQWQHWAGVSVGYHFSS